MTLDPNREEPQDQTGSAPDGADQPDASPGSDGPPVFQHPQWMVGIVLIFAVVAIGAGLSNPVWWLIGSPFILALVIYVWVWLSVRR